MRREELELGVRGSVYGREFCFGQDGKPYKCEIGYCCGDSECCTYYYELWWFWLAWTLIIMIGCCCAYRHRRVKLRHQQEQRQREISLMAYQGVASFPASLETWTSCKLPSYSEVTQEPPTPPPPYCEILGEEPRSTDHPTLTTDARLEPGSAEQEISLNDAQGPTTDVVCHANAGEVDVNGSERRRHITGDSGIVLCEHDDRGEGQGEREGKERVDEEK
ncbi:WW domain-binding protein 1-like [Spea bombifrons]|uniref:WW domain-binding protein 1-like n=1 Tax=Spea bombifrons TaxID=233779 RepID=UPI00234A8CFE|nr:WW domain-binding protein 1-like [Spea bombifrons]